MQETDLRKMLLVAESVKVPTLFRVNLLDQKGYRICPGYLFLCGTNWLISCHFPPTVIQLPN